MMDWQFLHGLPTMECGSWLVRQRKSMCGKPLCATFKTITEALRLEAHETWFEQITQYECQLCMQERKRRHRVLPSLNDASAVDDVQAQTNPGAAQDLQQPIAAIVSTSRVPSHL